MKLKNFVKIFDLELNFSTGKFYIGWFWVIVFFIQSYPILRSIAIWLYEL